MKLGLITIGQSPRVDVVPEMKPYLGETEIVELGALDGLSPEEIRALSPKDGEPILVSRLKDGTQVKLNGNAIAQRLKECVKKLENEVDIIGLLCTGEFKDLSSSKPLIEPSLLLTKSVEALSVSKLGILIPDAAQEEMTLSKWHGKAREIRVSSVSPYTGTEKDFIKAGETLKSCDLIVLDCIGYSLSIKKLIRKITGKPTILPRTLMARVIGELLEG